MSAKVYSTRVAAKQIGVSRQTLQAWIAAGKIAAPELIGIANAGIRLWTKADVEKARKFKGRLKPGPAKGNSNAK
jgi:excisionase family DNA binding protein